ncbi:MAG: IS200/IS605 family transposase, partial [Cyanobacteria bacterium J06641_5]
MDDDFISSGRAVSDLKAHLILTTKYRRKVFTQSMIERLQSLCCELCIKWDCKPIEVNGEADHIHLLFQYPPQLALPNFVGYPFGVLIPDFATRHRLKVADKVGQCQLRR